MSESYRQVCFEAHGQQCAACGTPENIVAHHLDGDRTNNTPENLRPMCRSCHRSVHNGGDGFEEWTSQLPDSAIIDNSVDGYRPFEIDILRVLKEDYANPLYIQEATGLSKSQVGTGLVRLGRGGLIRQVTRGLYEITDDGRNEIGASSPTDAVRDDLERALEYREWDAVEDALARLENGDA